MSRMRGAGLRWAPRRLGRSLPIYKGLWIARGAGLAIVSIFGLWAWSQGRAAFRPDVEPLEAAAVEQIVGARLAKVDIGHWTPGEPLPESEAPDWLPAPAPRLAGGRHPDDVPLRGRAADLTKQARGDAAADRWSDAATRLVRAEEAQSTWQSRYNAGVGLHVLGDRRRAAKMLDRAVESITALRQAGADSARHFALQVATRDAAATAALDNRDCIQGIAHQRRAVRGLRRYVDAEGALVVDRKWPFRVSEVGLDNHAVWGKLAHAYSLCDDRFPDDFIYADQTFDSEYTDADLGSDEILQGPFTEGLTACINASKPKSHCWGWSNVNKVLWASRDYLPIDGEGSQRPLDDALVGSLARLAYNAAWLAARSEHEGDRSGAGDWLAYAMRLDRRAQVPQLTARIVALGRHLAPLTGDHSVMAETWRRRDLDALELDADLPNEELKGAAWALSEHWNAQLRDGRPAAIFTAIDGQVRRAGPHGPSLQAWRESTRATLRAALAEEIRVQRGNQNPSTAVAIRDYRADWLGAEWPSVAASAWRSPGMLARWVGLGLLCSLVAIAVWLAYRLVAFPYLVLTAEGYRPEHRWRHAERQKMGLPFTRDEIENR